MPSLEAPCFIKRSSRERLPFELLCWSNRVCIVVAFFFFAGFPPPPSYLNGTCPSLRVLFVPVPGVVIPKVGACVVGHGHSTRLLKGGSWPSGPILSLSASIFGPFLALHSSNGAHRLVGQGNGTPCSLQCGAWEPLREARLFAVQYQSHLTLPYLTSPPHYRLDCAFSYKEHALAVA